MWFEKRAALSFGLDATIKLVDQIVGPVKVKSSFKTLNALARVLERIPEVFGNALILQVGLAIKVLGLHVADAFVLRALDHNHISREELVLCHFDEVADLNISPTNIFKALLRFVIS